MEPELESLVSELTESLRLKKKPRVIVSDVSIGPAVMGVFRHLIVLPKCLVTSALNLRPILAHELLHIRRGDVWVAALQAAVRCLWWFHPAVWAANKMLSHETERCCDEQVIRELNCSPGKYARSLLAVIESKHRLKHVPIFPGMKSVEITSDRMERIMSLKHGSYQPIRWWSGALLALFAFVVLPGADPPPAMTPLSKW